MWEIPVLLLIYMLLTYFFAKTAVNRTPGHGGAIHSKKPRKASPETKERRDKITQTEKVSPEVANERGKVHLLEYTALREHRVEMVYNLVPEKVISHLKQNEIIDQDDVERIEKKCKELRRKGAEIMLDTIYNSGNWAFKKLIAALQHADYQELAQKLTVDLEKSVYTTKQKGRMSEVEFEVLRDNHERLVDELDSSVLKSHLFETKLIDEDDLERISKKEEELKRKVAEEMVTIIYDSGANAFLKLLITMVGAGCDELSSKQERARVEQNEKLLPEVTKERGKVPFLEYTVLKENRVEMVNKLIPEKIIPYLKQNNVFDRDDVEKIEKKCKDLRRKGAETMLDIIYNSGNWAFKKLIEALQQAEYQKMAHKLTRDLEKETTEPHSATSTNQKGRVSGIEFEVLRDNHERLVNELDSSVLKNHLFKNGLIDEDDLERISKKEEELRKKGAEEMVTIIHESGANTFPRLLKSLVEAGYDVLSRKLDSDLKQKKKERANIGQNENASPEVTKKRRKVSELEYTVLRENQIEMVKKLVPEKVIPYLKQNNVFDHDDVEKIEKKCEDLRRDGAVTMFFLICESESCSFKKLIAALEQAGYHKMAQKLRADLEKKTTDPHSASTIKQRGRFSGIEFEVLRDNHERLVNELDSSVLKNHLYENGLISEYYLKVISKLAEEIRKQGAEEMVSMMYTSGSNAFPQLLKSLAEAGYEELSSKLECDLKQKKKETVKGALEIDLNSVSFPDYPVSPELRLRNASNWRQEFTKWKQDNEGKLWCVTMNKWFKDHEFFTCGKELKIVVKYWLLKLEEVVGRGCLEIDEIDLIISLFNIFQIRELYLNIQPNEMGFFLDMITFFEPNFSLSMNEKDVIQPKTAEKKRLHEQQLDVFKKLKYNLEGIIEGKQSFDVLSIDTDSCELAGYFHSVVDDVREIWNKLH